MRQHSAAGFAEGEGRDYSPRLPGITFRTSRLALIDLNQSFESFAALRIQVQDRCEDSENEQWYMKLDMSVTLLGKAVYRYDPNPKAHGYVPSSAGPQSTGASGADGAPNPASIVPEQWVAHFVRVNRFFLGPLRWSGST